VKRLVVMMKARLSLSLSLSSLSGDCDIVIMLSHYVQKQTWFPVCMPANHLTVLQLAKSFKNAFGAKSIGFNVR